MASSRLKNSEQGQVLVLLVLMLTVLLGIAALVLDVGHAYVTQRSLQASTDAAALAGAQELPEADTAEALAHEYSGESGSLNESENIAGVSVTVTAFCREGAPCDPVNAVEVKETAEVTTQFAKLLGIDSITVSTRAVAWQQTPRVPWAIFAYDSACDGFGFKYNGNVFEVSGGIRSNGEFEANGMNIVAGYASSGGPNGCEPVIDGDHIDFGGEEQPVDDPDLHDWPAYFVPGEFSCTYSAKKFTFNKNNQTIPPGVYCASETFEMDANHQTGNITVLAPEIKVNGNNQQLTPYAKDVLFFATGSKEMILNGNSYNWEGIIFHPGGRVKINGNADSSLTGMIEGVEVEVNGEAFRMVGTGPLTNDSGVQLVE